MRIMVWHIFMDMLTPHALYIDGKGGCADHGQLGGIVQQRFAQHCVDVMLVRHYEFVQIACSQLTDVTGLGGGRGGRTCIM